MDWCSWLSRAGLEPSIVDEYGLAFANNELEEEDITHFNHEFLQSMGISIAKHRLEILKLARKEHKNHSFKHSIAKLLLSLKKTKKCLASYMATLVHKNDDRAMILVPKKKKNNKGVGVDVDVGGARSYSLRWKKSMMIRSSKKLVMKNGGDDNQERLMLTDADCMDDICDDPHPLIVSSPKLDTFSSPLMFDIQQNKHSKLHHDVDVDVGDDQHHNYCWSPALEEIRWDAMFQDLNPT